MRDPRRNRVRERGRGSQRARRNAGRARHAYGEETTLKGKALLEEHGFEVVSHGCLENVTNIYDETPERAYRLGRDVDMPAVQAVFLSGLGMPTISILETLEQDLGKPVISAASATMWHALRLAGVPPGVPGYGGLLASRSETSG
jgi:maleate isomerase